MPREDFDYAVGDHISDGRVFFCRFSSLFVCVCVRTGCCYLSRVRPVFHQKGKKSHDEQERIRQQTCRQHPQPPLPKKKIKEKKPRGGRNTRVIEKKNHVDIINGDVPALFFVAVCQWIKKGGKERKKERKVEG